MKRLVQIVAQLRSPQGCPWDQVQTHQSLLPHLLEEAYEVIEEISSDKLGEPLLEELGDLLLQVVLHAQIAKEAGRFDLQAVIDRVSQKMLERHPHVFGDADKNQTQDQLNAQWDRIKAKEKVGKSVFDIPKSKPALLRAKKIGERAARLGFDWPDSAGVLAKIEEELAEVKAEIAAGDLEKLKGEIGDLLASVVSLARKHHIDPELALNHSNNKFIKRFVAVEAAIAQAKERGEQLGLEQMEAAWQLAKAGEL
ncbi:MAG: nucleoside triphosphate pyrophosphohydrolase [Candidatus Lambdaproteobacteria bacterium RIFOXYD12_FULL_49_8]|uniref:Nucleoside triphosphate pyrophosphohydrolase n=1 Tax=Candidatus Lambdaproteobacteria bacterium RIFOXYD2_FULL_50_16 TaxID=1817772 RepID=A0A1F6GGI4_9PROT|nr:MAG: nucleoside triphosphate pyrophosphohydrolase [Candidatus Lambdaproteobacteria bacterium RIFOXYD2_FULL_50_16]OGG97651.1 MAG: nucleoside triphosphate pyrophosphohydrolase [Candidatus Lambdaproteobacteria bacterium RIFOXYD12_FULL_49_8]